ncbi:protein TANC2-like [Stylophora pistillata]|uniref:protein TANC2-like n=1 Tax=Stylophora pistillata TaxID=50429 RepID=UPI000C05761C|nr:protein TANC2-like [Stylophora pistillata]
MRVRKIHLKSWFILMLLCHLCIILEDSYDGDGCALQDYSDQWELKNFDFSDFINSSKAEFIGRQWLYQEMETVLEHTENRGVLITGNPGSGKSAFLSYLLCSRRSSPLIHSRILGYHFCMHFDKGTQNGAKFVRNLANMIAWKLEEYGELVGTDPFVRRVLYKDCPQDSEWCFEQGILTPLKNLGLQPVKPWYIVIDALDECANDKAEVLNILKSKVQRLPKWLKLILSSRNVSIITASFEGLKRVELQSDDTKNLEDIDTYLSLKVFSWKDSLLHKIKTTLAITNNEAPAQTIVSILTEKGQGNFQFVKVVLNLWMASTKDVSLDTFPQTLDTSYQLYFERKYTTPESFQPLREIFEVLVAAYTPLTIHEIHLLLKLEHPALDLEYDLMPKLDLVSLFLWHGSGEGLIRIHHASLSEWLTSDNNKGKFYYIKKQNGHNRLAKYYLKKAYENNLPLKPDKAFHLASHIVEGGVYDSLVEQFLSLPSSHINTSDPLTQMTALHHSSSWFNADVTKLLVGHFSDVDSVDYNQRTPAFIAATSGYLKNLKILFGRGANLNRRAAYLDLESASHSKNPIKECRRKLCGYSLLHTAAQEGNNDVVAFLIQHKVNIFSTTGTNNTAMQLAAANGHLKTVQILQRAGGELDDISLHHAAAGGHNDVVQYLLKEGMVDNCVQNIPFSGFPDEEELESECTKLRLYDNHHLYLRETALHAAIARGNVDVIKTLLSENHSAINCPNSARRLPLHEAVYANNYNILETLLKFGVDPNVQCDERMLSSSTGSLTVGMMLPTPCPCGFASLHIAAKHGYHSVAEMLIKYKADPNVFDCNGSTPLHIASCHNKPSLITLLVNSGVDIDARSLNGSTPLHSAASCFSKDIFELLFDLGCDYRATDDEGMTALHYVVKDIAHVGFEYFADLYVTIPRGWIEKHSGASETIISELDTQYPWLNTFIKLVELVSRKEKAYKITALAMYDHRNRTVFHILEEKTNAFIYLTGSNRLSESFLVLSLTPLIPSFDIVISERVKNRVVALNKPYEQALVAKSLTSVISRAFTSTFTKFDCSYLLDYVRLHLVLAANTLLQAGVDVNCRGASGLTPLLVYLRIGGRHMSKVLVKHNVKVDIACGDPFEDSVFHLASYHKLHYLHYLYEYLLGSDNWHKYLQTKHALFDYFLDKYDEPVENR